MFYSVKLDPVANEGQFVRNFTELFLLWTNSTQITSTCLLPTYGRHLLTSGSQAKQEKKTKKSPRKSCLFPWCRFPGSRSRMEVEVMLKFMTLLAPHLEMASETFFIFYFFEGVRNRQNKTADVRTLPLLQPRWLV